MNLKRLIVASCAVLSMCAVRIAVASTPLALPSTAYVQDGLAAQWDGIDNAGQGQHVTSLATWLDLVGEQEISFSGSVSVGSDNSINVPAGVVGTGSCAMLSTAAAVTVEARARRSGSDYSDSTIAYFSNFMGHIGLALNKKGVEIKYPTSDTGIQAQNQNGNFADRASYATFSLATEVGVRSLSMNGAPWPNALVNSGTATGERSDAFTLGGGTHTYGAQMQSLRLYSRRLCAEEVRMNALVDSIRFAGKGAEDLPDGVRLSPTDSTKLQVRVIITPRGGAVSVNDSPATDEPYDQWVDVNAPMTIKVASATGRRVGWSGLQDSTSFSDDTLSVAFFAAWPVDIAADIFSFTHVWTGATGNGDYFDAGNWASAGGGATSAPNDSTADVFIPGGASPVVVSAPFTIGSLYVGALTNGSAGVSVEFQHTQTNQVQRNIVLMNGATLTHTALPMPMNTLDEALSQGYRCILHAVEGDFRIESGAKVTAAAKGFYVKKGPSPGVLNAASPGAAHGGMKKNTTTRAYGSTYYPYEHGSGGGGGSSEYGGGVIGLKAANGTIFLYGEVTAAGGINDRNMNSAGGSVLLEAGKIVGSGPVSASSTGGTGGGGRIALHQSVATDFSEFTGTLAAYGGNANVAGMAGCGTIYRRSAGQALAQGELIVDGGNCLSSSTAVAEVNDDESEFGNVTIRGGGRLHLRANQVLKVSGDLSVAADGSASDIENEATSVVDLSSGTNHLFSGSCSFANLVYTNVPDGKITFADGALARIVDGGSLSLSGTEGHLALLHPQTTEANWSLSIGADAAQDISYVAVANSDASAGVQGASATKSRDDQGNKGWAFVGDVEPGDPITWNGSLSSDWNAPENWTDKTGASRMPLTTDEIFIPAQDVTTMPRITAGTTCAWKLNIATGASLTLAGGNLIVSEALSVAGTLACAGEEVITCSNGVAFAQGAAYAQGQSVFRIVGENEHRVALAGCSFNKIQILKDGGHVTMDDGFTAKTLTVRAGGAMEIEFAAAKTVTVRDLLLEGAVEGVAALTLSSSVPGTAWKLDVSGTSFARGVSVADVDARGGNTVLADALSSGVRAQNWSFGNDCRVWTGAKNTTFSDPANWDPVGEIGPTTIPCVASAGAAKSVKVTTAGEVAALVLDAQLGAVGFEVAAPLAVAGGVNLMGASTVTFTTADAELSADGSVLIGYGVTITHAGPSTVQAATVRISAKGDLLMESGATIDVNGRGYQAQFGPGGEFANQGVVGSGYASRRREVGDANGQTYGSILRPTNWGSGGVGGPGGGAVSLVSRGSMTIDGTIQASSTPWSGSGTGGSVYLACAQLLGAGWIEADAANAQNYFSGSGGRIALVETEAEDFSGFVGTVRAESMGTAVARVGAGTVYRKARGVNEVRVGNGFAVSGVTDIPMADDGKAAKCYRDTAFVGEANVTFFLRADMRINDLDLRSATSKINLNGHTLTIRSATHWKGKGWGDTYENLVIENGGKIVWSTGLAVLVR